MISLQLEHSVDYQKQGTKASYHCHSTTLTNKSLYYRTNLNYFVNFFSVLDSYTKSPE